MARLFLSTSLGVALAFSSASGVFASMTATELITELQGAGVDASLVTSAQSSCAAGSASQCILALQVLLKTLPADLPASLVAEVSSFVSETAGSRSDVVGNPELADLNQTLVSLGVNQATGSVALAPTPAGNENPGGGSGSVTDDGSASAGAP